MEIEELTPSLEIEKKKKPTDLVQEIKRKRLRWFGNQV
jgi:hypothetical protein